MRSLRCHFGVRALAIMYTIDNHISQLLKIVDVYMCILFVQTSFLIEFQNFVVRNPNKHLENRINPHIHLSIYMTRVINSSDEKACK